MQPTLLRRAHYLQGSDGVSGVQPWRQRVNYETYRSPYGPQYKIQPHFHGINPVNGSRYAVMGAAFGVTAGIFALFFFDGVPRVQKDILSKLPVIGDYFVHEVPPEDNPF